jgi:hypothetical protein
MGASNFSVIRRLHHWKLNRTEIHMKRMTLLTALTLVFSLFTGTAAIAGSGEGTGQAEQEGDHGAGSFIRRQRCRGDAPC